MYGKEEAKKIVHSPSKLENQQEQLRNLVTSEFYQ